MKFVTRFVANYALLFQVVTFLKLLEQICRPKRIDRLYLEENHHHKILELLHQTWSGHVHKRQAVRVRMAYHCHQVPQTNSNNKTLGDGYGMTERTEVVLVEMPFMGRLWIIVEYCGTPVETLAAANPLDKLPLNYDQVFIRDFVPSALAFFLNGEGYIVENFLLHTLQLQVKWFQSQDSTQESKAANGMEMYVTVLTQESKIAKDGKVYIRLKWKGLQHYYNRFLSQCSSKNPRELR